VVEVLGSSVLKPNLELSCVLLPSIVGKEDELQVDCLCDVR
jgi:hypothetical protein